jgi:hypothetical protein
MLVKYTGPAGRRIVGEHEWNEENGFLVDVADAELVAVLLTEPRGGFEIAETDPLLVLIGSAQDAAELVLLGYLAPEDLPNAGTTGGRELAEKFEALGHLRGRSTTIVVEDGGVAADEV